MKQFNFNKLALSCFVSLSSLIVNNSAWAETFSPDSSSPSALINNISNRNQKNNYKSAKVGTFQYGYDQGIDENDQAIQTLLARLGVFESHIERLNSIGFNLPTDLPIVWMSCRKIKGMENNPENAFYSPDLKMIVLCYELVTDNYRRILKMTNISEEDALNQSLMVLLFVMYHELGHALIDFLDIPITGREEDAVDDFAAYMLLNSNNPQMVQVIVSAARGFNLSALDRQASQQQGVEHYLYWGEHSLDQQRFANLICIIYGSNPEKYLELAAGVGMTQDRANRCPSEYQQKVTSWTKLIIPHLYQVQGEWGNSGNSSSSPTNTEIPTGAWGD